MHQRIRKFSRILKLREDDRRSEQSLLAAERQEEKDVLDRLFSLALIEVIYSLLKLLLCFGKQ